MTKATESDDALASHERFDYERLKALELRGIQEYQELKDAEPLTAERVVAFVNQLSPWNLKTTGVSILEAYAAQAVTTAIDGIVWPEEKRGHVVGYGDSGAAMAAELEKFRRDGFNQALEKCRKAVEARKQEIFDLKGEL